MRANSRNVLILFFTLVVIMLGFGMVIPILPFYIKSFGASGGALGALMATYATMQFIFAPIWGSLSDHYGRKPILMVGVVGNILSQLFFGLSNQLWMLFAARILAGMLSSATLPTAMAYIGDSTPARERGGQMGLLGAAMGIGMVLGPGLAGWMAGYSLALPFFLAAGLSMIAFLLVYFILPESLPKAARHAEAVQIRGPQLSQMWQALLGPSGILFFMAFLLTFGLTNFESVFGLYGLERFGYGPEKVGALLTFIGIISALTQGTLTGPLTRRFGERWVIKASLLSSAIGFLLMAWAFDDVTVVLSTGFFIVSNAMLTPAVSALISRNASVGQGMAMGLNNAFMSLGRMTGPLWAGAIFDLNIHYPYWSGAVIFFSGFLISLAKLGTDHITKPVQATESAEKTSN